MVFELREFGIGERGGVSVDEERLLEPGVGEVGLGGDEALEIKVREIKTMKNKCTHVSVTAGIIGVVESNPENDLDLGLCAGD